MRILVVDPNPDNRRRIFAAMLDRQSEFRDGLTRYSVDSLDEAIARLAKTQMDAVVCCESFPTHPRDKQEPRETQKNNWAALASHCRNHDVKFLLYSDNCDLVDKMRAVKGLAFCTPKEVDSIVDALLIE